MVEINGGALRSPLPAVNGRGFAKYEVTVLTQL